MRIRWTNILSRSAKYYSKIKGKFNSSHKSRIIKKKPSYGPTKYEKETSSSATSGIKRWDRAFRVYSKAHHFHVLPADTFEGRTKPITRMIEKKQHFPPSLYGGRRIVTMIPGDAPGPKLMGYVHDVFKTAHCPVDFEVITSTDEKDPDRVENFEKLVLSSIYRNKVALKGNIAGAFVMSNISLRQELDLFACVVHAKSYPNIKCKYSNMDIYICRQNTEGEYAMLEHTARKGHVECLKIITEENTARFAEWVFEFAMKENRKKVTIVHKANIMKLSDGLFMKVVKKVGKFYPKLEIDDIIVDNCTMQMVQHPSQFDVLITPNLYGNIVSNIACGLIGGAGLMSGRNHGTTCALFEAGSRHLTFLDPDNSNPTAMLNASVDLLHHIGMHDHALVIHKAITKTIVDDKIHTADIGGSHTSDEMVECVKSNIKDLLPTSKLKIF